MIAMTHECLCILRFSNLCCSIAVILWSGLSEIILSKSSDTRSLMAECQKYQEVPIARTKASQTLHVCELWSCDLLSKFNCHYGIRPRQVFGCPLNGTLTSVIGRELVYSRWYGRRHENEDEISMQWSQMQKKAEGWVKSTQVDHIEDVRWCALILGTNGF